MVEFNYIYSVSVLIRLWHNLEVHALCFPRWLRKTIYIKAQNLVEFTEDIHILVNGAVDKPEVSFLFFSL